MLNFTCILAKMYVTHLINLEGGGVSAPPGTDPALRSEKLLKNLPFQFFAHDQEMIVFPIKPCDDLP